MQTILLTMLVKHVQRTSVELGREITNFLMFVLENKFPTRRKKITSLLRSNRIQIMTGAEYRYEKRFFDTLYFFFYVFVWRKYVKMFYQLSIIY